MNNSIEFVKEYLISNKEEILREVHDRNYVHHCRNFRDLKVEIQSEDRIPTEILSPIVKEMLVRFKELKKEQPNKPRPDIGWMLDLLQTARYYERNI